MSRVPGCTKFSYLTTTLANRASIAQAGSCKAPTAPGSLQSTKDAQPFESEQEAPTGFASRSSSSSQHCLLSSPSPSSSSRVWLRTAASLGRPPSRLPTHKRLLASSKPGAELGGEGKRVWGGGLPGQPCQCLTHCHGNSRGLSMEALPSQQPRPSWLSVFSTTFPSLASHLGTGEKKTRSVLGTPSRGS